MLENYDRHLNPREVIESIQRKNNCDKKAALSILRREIPKEKYFQDKIIKGVKKSYPAAFVRKMTLGPYSQGGFPDVLVIMEGHYFGFEVKRPIVGSLSALQGDTRDKIREAGGTAEVISYPEEAIEVIRKYFKAEDRRFDAR